MSRRTIASVTVVFALAIGATALAQSQWWNDPLQGETGLAEGFVPDPAEHSLTAGGGSNPQDVSELGYTDAVDGTSCIGFVTRSPDFRFNYTSTGGSLLRFYVQTHNGADAALLVNDSNGNWRCNDDSYDGLMPTVDFANAPAGQYDVWVGTYDVSSNNPSTLYITELDSNHP